MSFDNRQDDLLIAVALTEFSVHYAVADPVRSQWAWQLAADRFVEQDVRLEEVIDELEVENGNLSVLA
ncbi:hypothetical protein HYG82_20880 [Natrinema halophilum]|nr:hypothetical protein [Natrinema halophilum]UHQ96036.1 hypothetical protein HYG82_20880 [Natrinema halophilum]